MAATNHGKQRVLRRFRPNKRTRISLARVWLVPTGSPSLETLKIVVPGNGLSSARVIRAVHSSSRTTFNLMPKYGGASFSLQTYAIIHHRDLPVPSNGISTLVIYVGRFPLPSDTTGPGGKAGATSLGRRRSYGSVVFGQVT